jgi:hypothetical protein
MQDLFLQSTGPTPVSVPATTVVAVHAPATVLATAAVPAATVVPVVTAPVPVGMHASISTPVSSIGVPALAVPGPTNQVFPTTLQGQSMQQGAAAVAPASISAPAPLVALIPILNDHELGAVADLPQMKTKSKSKHNKVNAAADGVVKGRKTRSRKDV